MPPVLYHQGRFPPVTLDWQRLIPLLGPAAAAVARYDGMLAAIPNPELLLAQLTTQEAVRSSRIEGTEATMIEVLEFEAGREAPSAKMLADFHEVINYRKAIHEAERLLEQLPLSQRVIRETHKVLLQGVRGENRSPGEYRRIPNWIGPPGCPIDSAHFVPIGADKLVDAMSAWERYLHQDEPDRLVQLAVLHAEFEALHPFLDGNGRLGRILVPLFLWQTGLIRRPVFYISAYFEARRDAYYEGLLEVSRNDAWTSWCEFFLQAVQAQAEDNLKRVRAILALYAEMKRRVPEMTGSQYAIRAIDWLFQCPIFMTSMFIRSAGIPAPTARRFLGLLQRDGILRVQIPGRGRRAAILSFPALLSIADGAVDF